MESTYLQAKTINIKNLKSNIPFKIKIYLVINRSNDLFEKVDIFTYSGTTTLNNCLMGELNFKFSEFNLNEIIIDLNVDNSKLTHDKIFIGDSQINLSSKYQQKTNNLILYISIISTLIIILLFVIGLIIKIKRKHNVNKLNTL